jgi:hypothetical protein
VFGSTTRRSMRLGNEKSRLESTPPIFAVCRHFVSVFIFRKARRAQRKKGEENVRRGQSLIKINVGLRISVCTYNGGSTTP